MDYSRPSRLARTTTTRSIGLPFLIPIGMLVGFGVFLAVHAATLPQNSETPVKTPMQTVAVPTAAPTLPAQTKKELKLTVLNGSGETGAAGKVSAILVGFGYTVSRVGNADTFNYTDMTIRSSPENKDLAQALKRDLSSSETVKPVEASLPAGSTEIEVIVGK